MSPARKRALAEYAWNKAKAEARGVLDYSEEHARMTGVPRERVRQVAEWPLSMMGLAVALHQEGRDHG